MPSPGRFGVLRGARGSGMEPEEVPAGGSLRGRGGARGGLRDARVWPGRADAPGPAGWSTPGKNALSASEAEEPGLRGADRVPLSPAPAGDVRPKNAERTWSRPTPERGGSRSMRSTGLAPGKEAGDARGGCVLKPWLLGQGEVMLAKQKMAPGGEQSL